MRVAITTFLASQLCVLETLCAQADLLNLLTALNLVWHQLINLGLYCAHSQE